MIKKKPKVKDDCIYEVVHNGWKRFYDDPDALIASMVVGSFYTITKWRLET